MVESRRKPNWANHIRDIASLEQLRDESLKDSTMPHYTLPRKSKIGQLPFTNIPNPYIGEPEEILHPEEINIRVQDRMAYQAGRFIDLEKSNTLTPQWRKFGRKNSDLIIRVRHDRYRKSLSGKNSS